MYKNVQIWTKLEEALNARDTGQVTTLLQELGGVNASSDIGTTPLNIAAGESLIDMMQYLLDIGADVNGRCVEGYNAVFSAGLSPQAAVQGDFRAIDFLLDNGADMDAVSVHQTTALYGFIQMKMFRPAEYLVKKGARLDVKNLHGIELMSLDCPDSLKKLMEERLAKSTS